MEKFMKIKALNRLGDPAEYYLPMQTPLSPIELGTGRNAKVFLAGNTNKQFGNANYPGNYYAIKFLRDNPDKKYAETNRLRFFLEAEKTEGFSTRNVSFVSYEGKGIIGKIDDKDEFEHRISGSSNVDPFLSDSDEFENLKNKHYLQGPFYIMELCQATLYDVFERDVPWEMLTIYQTLKEYQESLKGRAKLVSDYIKQIQDEHFDEGFIFRGNSGYDILNHFQNSEEANRIRTNAVLQLFSSIAFTLFQLHLTTNDTDGLTHRDLKLGNIFLTHPVLKQGFDSYSLKLSDLGYIADFSQLERGDRSLTDNNWRTPGALAPGSQYFRAPEQAELPVEVRVNFDLTDKQYVFVKGSKVHNIEIGDWIVIADFIEVASDTEQEKTTSYVASKSEHIFKIINVEDKPLNQDCCYRTRLDFKQLPHLEKEEDLQAHIIKSTGFHTDGFSLGAILYDLISGGKNPEHFYTFCLAAYDQALQMLGSRNITTTEEVLNILSPRLSTKSGSIVSVTQMNKKKKLKILNEVRTSQTVEELIDSILEVSFKGETKDNMSEAIENYKFREFPLVSYLLKDKRGIPIPREVLKIIIKCMLRGLVDSYYRNDPDLGYLAESNLTATKRISTDVQNLLSEPEAKLPEGFPEDLKKNLLLQLRSINIY